MATLQLLQHCLATGFVYTLYKIGVYVHKQCTSSLNALPGPPNPSYIFGNLKLLWNAESSVFHEKWVEQYGPTITYNGLFSSKRLYSVDPKAINHILMNTYIYQKPAATRYHLTQIMGNGILAVEEDKHKLQRRIMNPAFGAGQVRELTAIFIEKSIQLRDAWAIECNQAGGNGRVEILSGLSKMALDVVGLAGFNYDFNTLGGETSELEDAFSTLFRSGTKMSLVAMVKGAVPALRFLTSDTDDDTKRARQSMKRVGNQLLAESKAAMTGNKETLTRRDLLSLLVRANMSTELKQSHRLSDEDVLAQVPTFLVAGHETVSTATTWALFALTQNMRVQNKLRQELLQVDTDIPSMEQLNALLYLDNVVREALRVHPPVAASKRVAVQDDVLPLGVPIKDKNGNMIDSIKIVQGQTIRIPILAMNRDKTIWGADAHEFRPERWDSIPEAAAAIPGVWGNMMTFLGGPRACIGYRFSLVEMKALLFTLVRAFQLELAVPKEDVTKKSSTVLRPFLKSDPKGGNQMPLRLIPVGNVHDAVMR